MKSLTNFKTAFPFLASPLPTLRASICAVTALALGWMSPATGHGASEAPFVWTEQPSGTTNNLFSVSVLNSGFAIAVGYNATVLKYDGTGWAPFPGFAEFAATKLIDATELRVSTIAGSNAVYVGSYNSGNGRVAHWNGTDWVIIQTGTGIRVTSMWSDSSGLMLAGRINGIISKFENGVYKNRSLDGTIGTTTVHRIAGSGTNNIWATGPEGSGSVLRSINGGASWTQILTPVSTGNMNPSFSLSTTQNWFHQGKRLFFYDGEAFTVLHEFASNVNAVYALSNDQVWVVGENLSAYYDGTQWQDLGLGNGNWRSIAGAGSDIWIVGDSGKIFTTTIPESSASLSLLIGGLALIAVKRTRSHWARGSASL